MEEVAETTTTTTTTTTETNATTAETTTETTTAPVESPIETVATTPETNATTAPVESPIETVATATATATTTTTASTSVPTASLQDEIDAEIRELYKVVSSKIRLSVANQKLTPENFQVILVKVVDTIEDLSSGQVQKLSGTEKRAIAINLTRLIIDDLHANGQIDDETYGWMSLGLTFLAPVLFDAAKNAWRKLQEVVQDVQDHGVSGCCGRNFFKRV